MHSEFRVARPTLLPANRASTSPPRPCCSVVILGAPSGNSEATAPSGNSEEPQACVCKSVTPSDAHTDFAADIATAQRLHDDNAAALDAVHWAAGRDPFPFRSTYAFPVIKDGQVAFETARATCGLAIFRAVDYEYAAFCSALRLMKSDLFNDFAGITECGGHGVEGFRAMNGKLLASLNKYAILRPEHPDVAAAILQIIGKLRALGAAVALADMPCRVRVDSLPAAAERELAEVAARLNSIARQYGLGLATQGIGTATAPQVTWQSAGNATSNTSTGSVTAILKDWQGSFTKW